MKARYLYIVSSPHGGSTLLSLVLGNHPGVANLGEVSFIPKLLALRELCSCGQPLGECEWWARVFDAFAARCGSDLRATPYGVFLGDAPKGKLGSGLIDTSHQTRARYWFSRFRGAVDTAALYFAPPGLGPQRFTLPSVRASIRNTLEFYGAVESAYGAKLIVDASKAPKKAPHLYLADPERVRILHLTRDGRGVAASRKKYMPVANAAERWNHYHRITLKMLERWVAPEHRMRLSYEAFVAEPQARLRELFSWLDMPYADDCLQFDEQSVMHSAGGNPARFKLAAGIRPADERWRTLLDAEDLRTFETRAGELNRYFGYG